jgi:hypothetical protein
MFSAPLFQLVMIPSRVFPRIASSEDSTMAPSSRIRSSAHLRSDNVLRRPDHAERFARFVKERPSARVHSRTPVPDEIGLLNIVTLLYNFSLTLIRKEAQSPGRFNLFLIFLSGDERYEDMDCYARDRAVPICPWRRKEL